jgi:SecD/SecF fusion protein
MKNRNIWMFLVVLALGWSIWEIYPPSDQDLITYVEREAQNTDTNFTQILEEARRLREGDPERSFISLRQAAGTNDLWRYFPQFDVSGETDPARAILQQLQREAAGKIKLGLDLQGGTSFLVAMDTNQLSSAEEQEGALSQAVEVLRKRVDRLGVAEPLIQPSGANRILIQMPGLSEERKAEAKANIQKAAFLEFRLVHERSAELLEQGITPIGYTSMVQRVTGPQGQVSLQPYLVKRQSEHGLTGKHVSRAGVIFDPLTGRPEISFTMNSEGASLFAQVTRENVGRQMAIILDGELYSAPRINTEILEGSGVIEGSFTVEEAFELANILINPLEAPVQIVEERGVDPSLGHDSIRSGIKASIIGALVVSGFMLGYYLLAGLVANVALVLNIIMLLGVMSSFGTTLTLPGIAGVVLTMGMAVDANVLIFERIREERAAGKSLRGSIAAGYSKAFGTIFDSNLTTMISSIILILLGTGPVKGFGVTLTIGIVVSMFTSLVVTRLIFDTLVDRGWLTNLRMFSLVKETKLDFLKYAKPAFVASWALIFIGLGYGVMRGHDVLGVDFAGGDQLTLRYERDHEVPVDQLRAAVQKLQLGDAMIQYQTDLSTGTKTLQLVTPFDAGDRVEGALKEQFPDSDFQRSKLDKVGPSVGREIQKSAIIASLLAMLGILAYVAVRYEFSFAIAAVVAIVHDVLMTMGWFFLSGRELSAPIVAAVLTIIGFSINDTIVIFDRIREDLRLGVRGSFRDIINHALNRTLSRTLITSGTTFLATLSLYVFGGGIINDFAFTFLVGIMTGTYSTIYIASAFVLWWHKGERPMIASQVTMESPAGVRAEVRA